MVQGWGDRQGLFGHPARAGLLAVFAVSTLALLFIPFDLFSGGAQEVTRQRWATYVGLAAFGALCWVLPYADRRNLLVWGEGDALRYAGLAAVILGTAVRVVGMAQLGALFSGFVAVQKGHHLVTHGLYRWVRHPIYTGSVLALLGLFLVFRSRLALIVVPLYVLGTLWRIHDEEWLLRDAFGGEYARYQARTWRLLPFVY
jgi:isoprenylcysteine carboxyl methyltransferase (ICMT) family protein YpbQ